MRERQLCYKLCLLGYAVPNRKKYSLTQPAFKAQL